MPDKFDQINESLTRRDDEALIELIKSDPKLLTRNFFTAGTLLHETAYWNMVPALKYIVSQGVDIETEGRLADSPIHQAVEGNSREAIAALLELGGDINSGSGRLPTPIFYAVIAEDLDLVEHVIQLGADVNASFVNLEGHERRPLYYAELAKNLPMVELLKSHGAEPAATDLKTSTLDKNRNWARLSTYIKRGSISGAKSVLNEYPALLNDTSPLGNVFHMSADADLPELIEFAVALGGEIDTPSGLGHTALFDAAGDGNSEIARLLLTHGADPNYGPIEEATPFFKAISKSHLELAELLLDNGADVNACFMKSDGLPRNALEFVTNRLENEELAQWLIDRGATMPTVEGVVKKYSDQAETICEAVLQGGHYQEAVNALTLAIDINPTAELHYQRGVAYDMLDELQKSLADFEEAITLDAEHFRALYSRSLVHRKLDNWNEAKLDLEAAIALNDQDFIVVNALANLLATSPDMALRDDQEAVELAAKACELTEWEDPVCLRTLAEAYRNTDRHEEAGKLEEDAAKLEASFNDDLWF